ncbi:UNKNOWN [Stylonychia lemnae]|uniref:Uncharacterized protein n=1 Tax=Stylonychia lemnae TaxID=5949 RepID=A0A077ZW08_STYLE|nr:UNKNOWN [Stylonychia lemnae]|eukprot:CDW74059.1 UNKNOWN [Stylonychia lemnae]
MIQLGINQTHIKRQSSMMLQEKSKPTQSLDEMRKIEQSRTIDNLNTNTIRSSFQRKNKSSDVTDVMIETFSFQQPNHCQTNKNSVTLIPQSNNISFGEGQRSENIIAQHQASSGLNSNQTTINNTLNINQNNQYGNNLSVSNIQNGIHLQTGGMADYSKQKSLQRGQDDSAPSNDGGDNQSSANPLSQKNPGISTPSSQHQQNLIKQQKINQVEQLNQLMKQQIFLDANYDDQSRKEPLLFSHYYSNKNSREQSIIKQATQIVKTQNKKIKNLMILPMKNATKAVVPRVQPDFDYYLDEHSTFPMDDQSILAISSDNINSKKPQKHRKNVQMSKSIASSLKATPNKYSNYLSNRNSQRYITVITNEDSQEIQNANENNADQVIHLGESQFITKDNQSKQTGFYLTQLGSSDILVNSNKNSGPGIMQYQETSNKLRIKRDLNQSRPMTKEVRSNSREQIQKYDSEIRPMTVFSQQRLKRRTVLLNKKGGYLSQNQYQINLLRNSSNSNSQKQQQHFQDTQEMQTGIKSINHLRLSKQRFLQMINPSNQSFENHEQYQQTQGKQFSVSESQIVIKDISLKTPFKSKKQSMNESSVTNHNSMAYSGQQTVIKLRQDLLLSKPKHKKLNKGIQTHRNSSPKKNPQENQTSQFYNNKSRTANQSKKVSNLIDSEIPKTQHQNGHLSNLEMLTTDSNNNGTSDQENFNRQTQMQLKNYNPYIKMNEPNFVQRKIYYKKLGQNNLLDALLKQYQQMPLVEIEYQDHHASLSFQNDKNNDERLQSQESQKSPKRRSAFQARHQSESRAKSIGGNIHISSAHKNSMINVNQDKQGSINPKKLSYMKNYGTNFFLRDKCNTSSSLNNSKLLNNNMISSGKKRNIARNGDQMRVLMNQYKQNITQQATQ